jgi:hypothetical protein
MQTFHAVFLAVVAPIASACTSFATLRSAEVQPGPSVALHASLSTPPGDAAGWFWSFDCAQACDHPVVGGDLGFTYGLARDGGERPVALGVGTSGTFPYLDAYVQLGAGRRPFGMGARFGLPATSWREHQLYARYDVGLGDKTRLLLNPALFLHEGRAPNGESPGSFVGFVQGVGLLFEGERMSLTPSLALVAGRAQRNSYGQAHGPVGSIFGTASLGVTFHRRRSGALNAPRRH